MRRSVEPFDSESGHAVNLTRPSIACHGHRAASLGHGQAMVGRRGRVSVVSVAIVSRLVWLGLALKFEKLVMATCQLLVHSRRS